jgi:polyhydroxybutyrate depolymerase
MKTMILVVTGVFLVATMFILTTTSYGAPPSQATATPQASPPPEDGVVEPGDYGASIVSAGLLRHYFFHVPEGYDGETALPLLISFHGFTSSPQQNMRTTQFTHMADDEGFIAVFPEGYNDPGGWYAHDDAELEFPDDVQFTRDLISDMRARYAVDPTRIYITGFSNGGGMAHRVGCDMADVVAAVAAAGGTHIDEDPCLNGHANGHSTTAVTVPPPSTTVMSPYTSSSGITVRPGQR